MNDIEIIRKKRLEYTLLDYEPQEAIGPIFSYFAEAFKDAPDEKINEFFELFESGVRIHLRHNRILKTVPWLKDYS